MTDVELTLHPNTNGTIDPETNIYPKVKASCIIDKNTVLQHKLTAGNGINISSENVISAKYDNNTVLKQFILDFVYPIGSIYVSVDGQDPSTKFGGTWERIEDTFLYAAKSGNHETEGDLYPGDTGGSNVHTLTVAEMPTHKHSVSVTVDQKHVKFDQEFRMIEDGNTICRGFSNLENCTIETVSGTQQSTVDYSSDILSTKVYKFDADVTNSLSVSEQDVGSSQEFSILPKYIAVYMWKRVE